MKHHDIVKIIEAKYKRYSEQVVEEIKCLPRDCVATDDHETVWEDWKDQLQSQHYVNYDMYEDLILDICQKAVEGLPNDEQQFLWLWSDAYFNGNTDLPPGGEVQICAVRDELFIKVNTIAIDEPMKPAVSTPNPKPQRNRPSLSRMSVDPDESLYDQQAEAAFDRQWSRRNQNLSPSQPNTPPAALSPSDQSATSETTSIKDSHPRVFLHTFIMNLVDDWNRDRADSPDEKIPSAAEVTRTIWDAEETDRGACLNDDANSLTIADVLEAEAKEHFGGHQWQEMEDYINRLTPMEREMINLREFTEIFYAVLRGFGTPE